MGGESPITETIGLGGFAQACALSLQEYQGGSPEVMIRRNEEMYQITAGENTVYKIPLFGFRGTPTGVDIFKVLNTGVLPVMDVGLAGKDGGQIGAGVIRAPRKCFRTGRSPLDGSPSSELTACPTRGVNRSRSSPSGRGRRTSPGCACAAPAPGRRRWPARPGTPTG